MYQDLGKGLEIIFFLAVFFFLMFVASIFVVALTLIVGWNAWYLLTYSVATVVYVALRLTVLSID